MSQSQRDVCIFTGIVGRLAHVHAVYRYLFGALADKLFYGYFAIVQKIECKLVEVVPQLRWIQQIGSHHRIEVDALECDTVSSEDDRLVFYVLTCLLNGFVFEQRFQTCQNTFDVELLYRCCGEQAFFSPFFLLRLKSLFAMGDGYVTGRAGFCGDRDPNQFGPHRVFACGFEVYGEMAAILQLSSQFH